MRMWGSNIALIEPRSFPRNTHPEPLFSGSSHQSVPGLVQGIDFKFEELLVSEPVGLFLERFDFVVCALQRSC